MTLYIDGFAVVTGAGEMILQDSDCIAAAGMFWRLAKGFLPSEVIEPLEVALQDGGLPRMATRNVEEGMFLIYYLSARLTET